MKASLQTGQFHAEDFTSCNVMEESLRVSVCVCVCGWCVCTRVHARQGFLAGHPRGADTMLRLESLAASGALWARRRCGTKNR